MKIIYHTPVPLNPNSSVGCGIRPIKMLEAFKNIATDVTVVAGNASERRASINKIKNELKNGCKYDFCYSESPPLPTLLSEKHRLPLHPFLDFGFFKKLKSYGIPIGLFYRDIYWAMSEYPSGWGPIKNFIANYFYKYDVKKYSKLIDIFYLPSLEMGKYVPLIDPARMRELPPGCDLNISLTTAGDDEVKIFYVGGMGNYYQMHELFGAISESAAELCICNRESEWKAVEHEYKNLLNRKVHVVHKSGGELNALYEKSNIASLFLKPDQYRTFAAPLKLYEYIGRGKPIIATHGTLAADFIEKNKIGWSVPYRRDALKTLIEHLQKNPDEIKMAHNQMKFVALQNTWNERALTASRELMRNKI